MRILGIDYGDARIGLALSDASATLCGRAWTLTEWNLDRAVAAIADVVRTEGVERIVLGLPKNMDGTEGPRAEKSRAVAQRLTEATGLEVVLWDERRSSIEAHGILHANGRKEKKHRQTVDTVLLLTGLTGCARRGDTSGVEIVVGASEQFSDEDIRGAMDAAMRAFHRGHSGCAMVRLAYNEAYRTCWLAGAGAQDDGNTIVLLASVYARDPGRRSGLTAGETYTDWPIVLERRGSGWHVVSSGY